MQQMLALDLKDDPELITEYEDHHRRIWPSVAIHMREHGVLEMEIFRLGTRLVMRMVTDDERFDATVFAEAQHNNPEIRAWEALMEKSQQPTPFSQPHVKWMPMPPIFRLSKQFSAWAAERTNAAQRVEFIQANADQRVTDAGAGTADELAGIQRLEKIVETLESEYQTLEQALDGARAARDENAATIQAREATIEKLRQQLAEPRKDAR